MVAWQGNIALLECNLCNIFLPYHTIVEQRKPNFPTRLAATVGCNSLDDRILSIKKIRFLFLVGLGSTIRWRSCTSAEVFINTPKTPATSEGTCDFSESRINPKRWNTFPDTKGGCSWFLLHRDQEVIIKEVVNQQAEGSDQKSRKPLGHSVEIWDRMSRSKRLTVHKIQLNQLIGWIINSGHRYSCLGIWQKALGDMHLSYLQWKHARACLLPWKAPWSC